MKKVAFFDSKKYDINSFNSVLTKYKDISITYFETRLNKDTVNLTKGYDVVCVFVNDEVNKQVIDELYKNGLKLIALRCAGYNNVDVKYCFNKIHVVRVPSYSPYAVAEHAFALLLSLNRKIHKAYIRSRDFNFSLENLEGFDLNNKTIGVIGTGKIGKVLINIAKGFNMNVLAFDKYPDPSLDAKYVPLDELYRTSDVISLHCPLTNDNHYMINKDSIKLMKDNVMIINTSRGGLINSIDLLDALLNKKILGAGLDVYEEESDIFFNDNSFKLIKDDILARLISLPNVIVTSHQAFLTKEALENIANTTMDNIEGFFSKNVNSNELCYQCGKIDDCKKLRKDKCF